MGISLSFVLFFVTRGWEHRERDERAAAITHEQIEKLHISILRSMEVLRSIAALHRLGGQIERGQFRLYRGYECLMLSDCTGATDYGNYVAALKMIKMQGGVFGAVADSSSFIKAL